jgi:hypothetical protein
MPSTSPLIGSWSPSSLKLAIALNSIGVNGAGVPAAGRVLGGVVKSRTTFVIGVGADVGAGVGGRVNGVSRSRSPSGTPSMSYTLSVELQEICVSGCSQFCKVIAQWRFGCCAHGKSLASTITTPWNFSFVQLAI